MGIIDDLTQLISTFPGLGKKSASRIVYYLLRGDKARVLQFSELLENLHKYVRQCSVCGAYTEADTCELCMNDSRNHSVLCVVEHPQDVVTLETSREYSGVYHVLGGVISPIDGIGPEDLRITSLIQRINSGDIQEVIIATNPTVEGETTALYIAQQLKQNNIQLSRPALGLPVGGDLEYADRLTIARSLQNRTSIHS